MSRLHVAALMEAHTVTGPAKNLLRFARLAAASPEGVRVSIVTFVRGAVLRPNAFIEAVRAQDIPIYPIHERFRFDPGIVSGLRQTLSELRPDIVQTHGVKSHFLVRRLRPRPTWVAFHHGYTAEDLKMHVYNQLNRWTLPDADCVITVCKPFCDLLAAQGVRRERLRTLPNSIEAGRICAPEETAALRQRFGIAAGETVLLAVGRFSPEKGHLDLMDAVARLLQRRPGLPFRLVLVGDGPERARIAAAAVPLGDRAVFAGHQSDVAPFYAIANAFVLPSHSEGSPNVLLEAMMAGLPIAATAVGGVPETVEDGVSALLVAPRDPEALSLALEQLICGGPVPAALAKNAAAAVRRFSPAAYCEELSAIYAGLCRETPICPSSR